MTVPVTVTRAPLVLPTYEPAAPDRNPMFFETRVYQGSSGRVYPLPFYDRIAEQPAPRAWDAITLENAFLSVLILPELGGRIHRLFDKTNGYDAIYYQPIIKPALVGLAGPWVSGGIEFNWPQHHRPSTYLPVEVHVERHDDGAVTVWLSEHEPMSRMKGMHGVHLHPERAVLELRVRCYNRTADTQTFLWWANVATRVHERYQSFFPPDATWVADHAKRATSTFPFCTGRYYGVDYASRGKFGVPASEVPRLYVPPHCASRSAGPLTAGQPAYRPDDLSWYANIPVPTSYMCMGSREDFFGGYDHGAEAGLVHVADHHIAPGKKQWTWGNHEFGYAWDRNLTDADASGEHRPYIELMAGVYTDNQPDFSFLQPGETKTWTQCWYPIQKIGPVHRANAAAAVSLQVEKNVARLGVVVTASHGGAVVRLRRGACVLLEKHLDLAPGAPLVESVTFARGTTLTHLTLEVLTAAGERLIDYSPRPPATVTAKTLAGAAATEPPMPRAMAGADELYLTGLHLEQYRHATRCPADYWREGLRRDPGDSRCLTALGRWHLRRGEFTEAERHLRAAVARLTRRNPNPADGEAHYQLGLCLRHLADAGGGEAVRAGRRRVARDRDQLLDAAYDAFYKATWNQAWQSAGYFALAQIDCRRAGWPRALEHLDRCLRLNADHLQARDLRALVLCRVGRADAAERQIRDTLALDPLDAWARHLAGFPPSGNTQTLLDLVLEYVGAGFHAEARALLELAAASPAPGSAPLLVYYRAWVDQLSGDKPAVRTRLADARTMDAAYCFPARLEEQAILRHTLAVEPKDGRAHALLGHWLYDRRRHREAIAHWRAAVRHDPRDAVAWRCLGIASFNILQQPSAARRAYAAARRANPRDARLLYESDQLEKRLGASPAGRLRELERHPDLVRQRDDLCVELATLYNQTGRPAEARVVLDGRRFQPWEGGEGRVLGQHVRTQQLLGRSALAAGDIVRAHREFEAALAAPENLGEAKHLLANQSDLHLSLGDACAALGDRAAAQRHWRAAADFRGDFQAMSVRTFSEMTYYSAVACRRLGQKARALRVLRELLQHARRLARTPAQVDYFATSLSAMLLFADDLKARQRTTALFLEAQARLGRGQTAAARRLLRRVLQRDPSHALAQDLLATAWD